MPSSRHFLSKVFRKKSHARYQTDSNNPPTVSWLLEHRAERHGISALTQGKSPLASLYRMYEYLATGFIIGLRSEIEFFYNQPWAVSAIPDPKDPDPERYAILAVLPFYLVVAFNRLIDRGLPRGSPAMIISDEMEEELKSRAKILEEEPLWAKEVPRLAETLVIPGASGEEPSEESKSERFLTMNIVAEEPHVLFV